MRFPKPVTFNATERASADDSRRERAHLFLFLDAPRQVPQSLAGSQVAVEERIGNPAGDELTEIGMRYRFYFAEHGQSVKPLIHAF